MEKQISRLASTLRRMNLKDVEFIFGAGPDGWSLRRSSSAGKAVEVPKDALSAASEIMAVVDRKGTQPVSLTVRVDGTMVIRSAEREDEDIVIDTGLHPLTDAQNASVIARAEASAFAACVLFRDETSGMWTGTLARDGDLVIRVDMDICGAEMNHFRVSYGSVHLAPYWEDVESLARICRGQGGVLKKAISGMIRSETEVTEGGITVIARNLSTVSKAPATVMEAISKLPCPESHSEIMSSLKNQPGMLMIFMSQESEVLRAAAS